MPEGPIAAEIRRLLSEALSPAVLEIEDDSWKHAGHHHDGGMDAKPGGESHFNLRVVADAFEGKSRVERQRMINAPLRALMAGRVHALAIRAQTPDEADASG